METTKSTLRRRTKPVEQLIGALLFFCASVSVLTTIGIVWTLLSQSVLFFRKVSPFEFLTGTVWQPQIEEFGVLPLVTSTLVTSFLAMLIAIPIGMAIAVYLAEYASSRIRNTLKPVLEVLAGVPTIVYGYFALTMVTPLLRRAFGEETVGFYNMASAGIVMGILILPLVASMAEDALSAVPRSMRDAAWAMGATRFEVTVGVVIPGALSGILAAFILALSRAVGETMIVALAAGAGSRFTLNPFAAAETMTGHIVRISGGDLSYDSIDYDSLFAIALLLFVITYGLNILSRRIIRRFGETAA